MIRSGSRIRVASRCFQRAKSHRLGLRLGSPQRWRRFPRKNLPRAGHPPLQRWRGGKLERIESNGLLLGVLPDAEYPVCEMEIQAGDRFLLYTDGMSEPENGGGEAFGEHRLEQVVRDNRLRAPSEFLEQLLAEIHKWQPASTEQKDDITLVAIDVLS